MNNPVSFLTGLALGIGATLAARDLAPGLGPHARTLAKQSLKFAVRGFEWGRESTAIFAESLSDLLAEVHTELSAERAAAPPGGELLAELLAEDQPPGR